MKTGDFLTAIAVSILFFTSCGKVEPSTYHEQIYRVGTVTYRNGQAGIMLDCYNTQLALANFKDTMDMMRFGVNKDDRVIIQYSYDAVGSLDNATMTLDQIKRLPTTLLVEKAPSDTLNNFFCFSKFAITNVYYPYIWSAGHFVNVAPAYNIPSVDCKSDFYIYPTGVSKDTLLLQLYSDIPEAAYGMNTQTLLTCDISSMRKAVSDTIEQARRDSLMQILDNLGVDSIFVQVSTPDTMRAKNASAPGGYRKYEKDLPQSVKISFDF